jgi:hypothetical protein
VRVPVVLGSMLLLVAGVPAQEASLLEVDLDALVPPRWIGATTDDWPLQPERQRRRQPPECQTRGGYRDHCQGARHVPEPRGPEAALAARLDLGRRATALYLLHRVPLEPWMDAVADFPEERGLLFPVDDGRLGRGFGRTRRGSLRRRRHLGVDIGAPEGATIRSARSGLVAYSDNGLVGYGNVVIVLHRGGFSTLYAHASRTLVFAGQRVARGDAIAEVGMTGFAPAPHLHFEFRQRGLPRDPTPEFRRPR